VLTSREKKKREKKKSTRKNFAPGMRTRSRARDAPRALETHPIAPKLDERVRNARTETSEKNRTRRGRIEPTTAFSAASASRAAPSAFPFWKTRRRRVRDVAAKATRATSQCPSIDRVSRETSVIAIKVLGEDARVGRRGISGGMGARRVSLAIAVARRDGVR
jgi:hypothetical protein